MSAELALVVVLELVDIDSNRIAWLDDWMDWRPNICCGCHHRLFVDYSYQLLTFELDVKPMPTPRTVSKELQLSHNSLQQFPYDGLAPPLTSKASIFC